MNQTRTTAIAIAMLGALAGCASPVTDVGEADDALSWVDKAQFTDQLLYLDLAIASMPLTAEAMGDTSNAIPVEVRFYDDWAVAWWAPDGVARNEHFMNAVGAWQVVDNATAQPTADDVVTGRDEEDQTRAPGINTAGIDDGSALGAAAAVPTTTLTQNDDRNWLPWARLAWYEGRLEEWREMPPGFHPGCI